MAMDTFGIARHMASFGGRRHSFDLLWLNADHAPEWPVRAAAHSFAGTLPREHPFPSFRRRANAGGGYFDMDARGSPGMKDALDIYRLMPSVVHVPWKWSKRAARAITLLERGTGHPHQLYD